MLCVLERDAPLDVGIPAAEAAERFGELVTALRLWGPGFVSLGAPGWMRHDDGRWQPLALGTGAPAAIGPSHLLAHAEEEAFREFFAALAEAPPAPRRVAWALRRFELGCERARDDEALSDYLLALRALLDGEGLALRLAALCAEEGRRKEVQRRVEAAVVLEREVMDGAPGVDLAGPLVAEVESHLRALLRDLLCGYLDTDLRAIADDILLETPAAPAEEIRVRDLREPEPSRARSPSWSRPAPGAELRRARHRLERPTPHRPSWSRAAPSRPSSGGRHGLPPTGIDIPRTRRRSESANRYSSIRRRPSRSCTSPGSSGTSISGLRPSLRASSRRLRRSRSARPASASAAAATLPASSAPTSSSSSGPAAPSPTPVCTRLATTPANGMSDSTQAAVEPARLLDRVAPR